MHVSGYLIAVMLVVGTNVYGANKVPASFMKKEHATVTFVPGKSLEQQGWKEKVFSTAGSYRAETHDGVACLHARSSNDASMVYKKFEYDPEEYPLLRWRWKVTELPKKGKENTRPNNDYAARLYIIFPGWGFFNSYQLQYVWDNHAPPGTVKRCITANRCNYIVVTSGKGKLGTWVTVERNLREDIKKAFGRELGMKVGAIGFMSDSDNTASTAEVYYGALVIEKATIR